MQLCWRSKQKKLQSTLWVRRFHYGHTAKSHCTLEWAIHFVITNKYKYDTFVCFVCLALFSVGLFLFCIVVFCQFCSVVLCSVLGPLFCSDEVQLVFSWCPVGVLFVSILLVWVVLLVFCFVSLVFCLYSVILGCSVMFCQCSVPLCSALKMCTLTYD